MIDELQNAMNARALGMAAGLGQAMWGIVTSVDHTRPAVRVLLQPAGVLTGWMPVLQMAAGGGWSVTTIPTPGMQAFVAVDSGDPQNGVVLGFAHSDGARLAEVPATEGSGGVPRPNVTPLAAGESIMTGPGGQVIRLGAAGIYMRGTVMIDGNLRVNGEVGDKAGTLDNLRQNYNAHRHTGVQAGSGTTGTTTEVDP